MYGNTYDETHRALRIDGTEVQVNDQITSFRGERWTFRGITRVPGDGTGTNGKIVVTRRNGHSEEIYSSEFYPSVFNLAILPRPEVARVAWEEALASMCKGRFVTAGSDPYSTDCDLDAGHYPATPHEGDNPFGGEGRIQWRGGGSIAGDLLPQRDVTFIEQKDQATRAAWAHQDA